MGAVLFLIFAVVTAVTWILLKRDELADMGALNFIAALFMGGFALAMTVVCIAAHRAFVG